MTKDKQIEEMAVEMGVSDCKKRPCRHCAVDRNCIWLENAERLYNAGYRKASEIEELEARLADVTSNWQKIHDSYTADCIEHYNKGRSDVAREIFEEIEKNIATLEYRANTPRKTVKVEELKAQVNWVLHEVVPKTLAELKKKYTEVGE